MSLLQRVFRSAPTLDAEHERRLAAWRALPEVNLNTPADQMRLVVVDVETSGLDLRADRLIAIGAVTIEALRIDLAQSFHAILRQPHASHRDNILVHGIGGTAQEEGEAPAAALLAFLEFCGKAPLVSYHAGFDGGMLRKAMRAALGEPFRRPWLDLAEIAPAVAPSGPRARNSLDDWLAWAGIEPFRRHDALADAFATAQLLQLVLSLSSRAGGRPLRAMLWHPRAARWLG